MNLLDITAIVSDLDRDRGILERIRARARGWLRTSSDRDIDLDLDRGILSLRDGLSGPQGSDLDIRDICASRICRQNIMLFQWILRTMLFMG